MRTAREFLAAVWRIPCDNGGSYSPSPACTHTQGTSSSCMQTGIETEIRAATLAVLISMCKQLEALHQCKHKTACHARSKRAGDPKPWLRNSVHPWHVTWKSMGKDRNKFYTRRQFSCHCLTYFTLWFQPTCSTFLATTATGCITRCPGSWDRLLMLSNVPASSCSDSKIHPTFSQISLLFKWFYKMLFPSFQLTQLPNYQTIYLHSFVWKAQEINEANEARN